jgi:hypothetical protein
MTSFGDIEVRIKFNLLWKYIRNFSF